MADNVTAGANDGLGPTFASDDDGTAQWPYTKVAFGADGTFTRVSTVAGSALPVQIRDAAGINGGLNVDASGNIGVTDASGSLTVDGTITAELSATDNAVLDSIDASLTDIEGAVELIDDVIYSDGATWTDDTSKHVLVGAVYHSSPQTITNLDTAPLEVDENGNLKVNIVAGSTAGTEFAEDTAHSSGAMGTMILGVRSDTPAALAGTDGDYMPLIFDSSGRLHVVTQGQDGGTSAVDDAAFTAATDAGTPIMGFVTTDQVSSGDVGVVGMDTARNLKVSIEVDNVGIGGGTQYTEGATDASITGTAMLWEDTGDTLRTVSAALPLPVEVMDGSLSVAGTVTIDGTVAVDAVVPGTSATQLGKAEDAAHNTGDTGVFALAVRTDTPTPTSGTTGDYEAFHTAAEGGLWVSPTPSALGGLSIFRSIDLDETEEQVKATPGSIYSMWVSNLATSTRFLKFYNDTAANVVVGVSTPTLTIAIPSGDTLDVTGFFSTAHGITFSTAITVAATTGVADADVGAPGTNEVLVNIFYK